MVVSQALVMTKSYVALRTIRYQTFQKCLAFYKQLSPLISDQISHARKSKTTFIWSAERKVSKPTQRSRIWLRQIEFSISACLQGRTSPASHRTIRQVTVCPLRLRLGRVIPQGPATCRAPSRDQQRLTRTLLRHPQMFILISSIEWDLRSKPRARTPLRKIFQP